MCGEQMVKFNLICIFFLNFLYQNALILFGNALYLFSGHFIETRLLILHDIREIAFSYRYKMTF